MCPPGTDFLTHRCKPRLWEAAMHPNHSSRTWGEHTQGQGLNPAPLVSPLQLPAGFLGHICSYRGSSQTGPCKPSPRDVISQMCSDVHIHWSHPMIWWDQGAESKWSWEDLDKSKAWALLPAVLSVPLSFLWVLHTFELMFARTFSASSQKAQRLRPECPLQPQTSRRSGFCLSLFLKWLQRCYFTLASCWTWP